jgi:hypothetical protein
MHHLALTRTRKKTYWNRIGSNLQKYKKETRSWRDPKAKIREFN